LATGDEILDWLLFYCSEREMEAWGVDIREVEQWTVDLVSGRIPGGHKTIQHFISSLKNKCSYSYNRSLRNKK